MKLFLCSFGNFRFFVLPLLATDKGGWHFLQKGVPNLQKVGVDKTAPSPHFGNKNFMTPHHRYTLPPKQAKIVLKSVFLNKINTLSVVTLWLPTFWSSKILWPPYFSFQKLMTPSIFGTPLFRRKCQPPNWPLHQVHNWIKQSMVSNILASIHLIKSWLDEKYISSLVFNLLSSESPQLLPWAFSPWNHHSASYQSVAVY